MKNHEITCFYGEKAPTTNSEYGTPKQDKKNPAPQPKRIKLKKEKQSTQDK